MRGIKFRAWHNGRMVYWGLFRNDDTYLLDEETSIDEDEDSIMQYTGLKDKNGKEIYEGDILRNGAGHMGKVEWYEPHALYILRLPNNTYDLWQISVERTEVIGNIYENPELLGNSKE